MLTSVHDLGSRLHETARRPSSGRRGRRIILASSRTIQSLRGYQTGAAPAAVRSFHAKARRHTGACEPTFNSRRRQRFELGSQSVGIRHDRHHRFGHRFDSWRSIPELRRSSDAVVFHLLGETSRQESVIDETVSSISSIGKVATHSLPAGCRKIDETTVPRFIYFQK
jgi:hypothetical protein